MSVLVSSRSLCDRGEEGEREGERDESGERERRVVGGEEGESESSLCVGG